MAVVFYLKMPASLFVPGIQTEATAGSSTIGASINLGYFSHYSSDMLNLNSSIYEEVAARLPNETIGYIKKFLVLDEPTNHLDIASREVLLEALQDFEGTVIIVSHDRYFLRNVVNRVFEIDHGAMKIFEGDYNYYLESQHKNKPLP